MQIEPSADETLSAEQAHIDAGDGVERTVTEARGGVRRGVNKILLISTALAIGALGAVWLATSHPKGPPSSVQSTGAASASASNALNSQAWDQEHLGADGLKKCDAFRKVLRDSNAIQGGDHGVMSPSQRSEIGAELTAAKTMPPLSLTPFQCGVPLG